MIAIILIIAGFSVQAAATLPILAALTMIAGRRGNADVCLGGSLDLINLALILASAGPVWFLGSYWQQMLAYRTDLAQTFAPLLMPAGFSWSGSLLAWLAGWLACFLCASAVKRTCHGWQTDSYPLKAIRIPLFFSLCSATLFFSTFILINWPFAGLPEGIGWDRVVMALWRNATSNYFLAFSNAGVVALVALVYLKKKIPAHFVPIAARWLSFWGMAGALPYVLTRWGYVIAAARARGIAAYGMKYQAISLSLLTGTAICCAILLWKPRLLTPLAWLAALMLLGRAFLPLLAAN